MYVTKNQKPLTVYLAMLTWFALILQFILMIRNAGDNGITPFTAATRFFGYFTILSNTGVAICLTVPLFKEDHFFSRPSTRSAMVVYILIVGIVYNTVLRQLWDPKGPQKLADELLHVAIPLLYTLYWMVYIPKEGLNRLHPFNWLLFPALYLIYALLRGFTEDFWAYPFINVKESGAAKVALNSAGLLIVFFVMGCGVVFIGRGKSAFTELKKD
jgi:hypothetical protein